MPLHPSTRAAIMAGAGLITIAVMLALVPLFILGNLIRLGWRLSRLARSRRHQVPLAQKNITRATFGGFLLVVTAGAALHGHFPPLVLAAAGSFGALYLVAGALGSQGARFDVISVFWLSIGAAGCVAALLYLKGVI